MVMDLVLFTICVVTLYDTHARIYTYTHTHIHTYTHAHMHTYIHTYTYIHIHTHTHTHIHNNIFYIPTSNDCNCIPYLYNTSLSLFLSLSLTLIETKNISTNASFNWKCDFKDCKRSYYYWRNNDTCDCEKKWCW